MLHAAQVRRRCWHDDPPGAGEDRTVTIDWINPVAGFAVGALVGVTGVGGGSLMTPILVLLFGMAPAAAVGTDLWFAALTKVVGGAMHHRRGGVDWQVVRRLALGSLPAAAATLWWLQLSGGGQGRSGTLVATLGGVLIATALAMLWKARVQGLGRAQRLGSPTSFKRMQPVATVAAGALLGVLVTLTSVGAGALGTVLLVYLYPLRMTPARLVGTDIVHAIPLTVVAGLGHLWLGNVDLALLGQLLLGSVPGIVLGSLLGARAPERVLRAAIAVVLAAVGTKLLVA
ncbi:MAG: sulfite exporter TauE/SafE family protein [Planctomycetes bacterium]|nr:sulfite exporter TauE/SafE family protein [Planctomycetota bacterium]